MCSIQYDSYSFYLPRRTISSRSPSPLPILSLVNFQSEQTIFLNCNEMNRVILLYTLSHPPPKNTEFMMIHHGDCVFRALIG